MEEWVAVVAVFVLLAAGVLAIAAYGWGYEPQLTSSIDGGLLAGAGLILAGAILFVDLLRDTAQAWIPIE